MLVAAIRLLRTSRDSGARVVASSLMLLAFGVGTCSCFVPFGEPFGSGRDAPRWIGVLALATLGSGMFVGGLACVRANGPDAVSRRWLRGMAVALLLVGSALVVLAFVVVQLPS
jgi:hypothetical protein